MRLYRIRPCLIRKFLKKFSGLWVFVKCVQNNDDCAVACGYLILEVCGHAEPFMLWPKIVGLLLRLWCLIAKNLELLCSVSAHLLTIRR